MRIRHNTKIIVLVSISLSLAIFTAFPGFLPAEEPNVSNESKDSTPSDFSLDDFFEDEAAQEKPTIEEKTSDTVVESTEIKPEPIKQSEPEIPTVKREYAPEEIAKAKEVYRLAMAFEKADRAADAEKYYNLLNRWADADISYDANNPGETKTAGKLLEEAKKRLGLKKTSWPGGYVAFTRLREHEKGLDVQAFSKRAQEISLEIQQSFEIKYVGQNNPFFDKCTFSMMNRGQDKTLRCYDEFGNLKWRLAMPNNMEIQHSYYYYNNSSFTPLTTYLKGNNHILYLASGKTLYAINTMPDGGGAEIIWKKEKADQFAPYMYSQSMIYSYMLNRNYYSGHLTSSINMISNPLHVGTNIVCYQDLDTIYGLDPLSGEIQWTCNAPDPQVSFAGDTKHVYLIPKNDNVGFVIGAGSGETVAAATLPQGVIHAYGSHVFAAGTSTSNNNTIGIYDLAGIMDLAPEFRNPQGDFPNKRSQLKYAYRKIGLQNHQSYIKFSHNGSIFEMFHANNFSMIDLSTGESILNVRIGSNEQTQQFSDIEVEKVDENFLITIYSHRNIQGNNNRSIAQFNMGNRMQRQIGSGLMMLYDKEGNNLWEKPRNIANCTKLPAQPAGLPVVLFGGAVHDNRSISPADFTRTYAMVFGVDKRTGEIRFAKQLGRRYGNNQKLGANNTKMPPLNQGFIISSEPENKQIIFTAPHVTFAAKFTNHAEKKSGEGAKKSTADEIARAIAASFKAELQPELKSTDFQKRIFERGIDSLISSYPKLHTVVQSLKESEPIKFD